jgi:hypothetical protein
MAHSSESHGTYQTAEERNAALSAAQPVPGVEEELLAFVGRIAADDPVFAKGYDKKRIFEARELVSKVAPIPTPQPVESHREPVDIDAAVREWRRVHASGEATNIHDAMQSAINAALATPPSPAQETPGFAETLNFYISDAENGLCRVPRQKMVEIQTELRRLATPAQGTVERAEPGKARDKLRLWFFRELTDEQRLGLFSIFGYPTREIGPVHGHQRTVLNRIFTALASPPVDSDAVQALDGQERMLLGWMLAAFEQSKIGHPITDDLKREMRDANRLVARLSAGSQGSGSGGAI